MAKDKGTCWKKMNNRSQPIKAGNLALILSKLLKGNWRNDTTLAASYYKRVQWMKI